MSGSINYHELTMEESNDSPARKKQFLVICVLGLGAFTNAFINAGGFFSVNIQEGVFPGGDFYYRLKASDYSSSMGHVRCTGETLQLPSEEAYADFLYSMYIDDTSKVTGVDTRYFVGAMFHSTDENEKGSISEKHQRYQTILTNAHRKDGESKPSYDSFCKNDQYEIQSLPPVKAGIAHFPNTNGFVSSVLQGLKVIPSMTQYAKEKGVSDPIAISTCSVNQLMCTHYVILEKTDLYLMGEPSTDDYKKHLAKKKGRGSAGAKEEEL